MEFPIIIITLIISVAVTRVLSVFIHEMGHAVAGLVLFKDDISIYIGSYGDPKKGVHFKIGRLKIHFKYNPLLWNHGACTSNSPNMSFKQGFIFTIAGPLASLLVALLSICILVNPESHGALKLTSIFLLFSSIPDFFQNIRPNDRPIFLHDGTITYNDGQTLKLLKEYKNVYKEATLLNKYYANNEIDKGISFFEETYSKNKDINILRMGIALNIKGENYEKAKVLFNELHDLNSDDYCNYALAHSHSGEHSRALELYNKAIEMNQTSFYTLNNRGYTLNILERYEEAIEDFNKAIEVNPNFAYAYNNRGLAKIKIGKVNEGLSDIENSMNIDKTNSYAYKNLGIYYKDKGDYNKAMDFFQQAKKYDPKTDGLQKLIDETEFELKNK